MAQSNIFEAGAAEAPALFGDYLEGPLSEQDCIVMALSTHALQDLPRTAIEKSLSALGLPRCTFASIFPRDEAAEGGDVALDAQSLFLLVEGLDPLRLIVTDQQALDLLGRAYRSSYAPDTALRVFGRDSVAFSNLAELVLTGDGKQKAWALFKTLA